MYIFYCMKRFLIAILILQVLAIGSANAQGPRVLAAVAGDGFRWSPPTGETSLPLFAIPPSVSRPMPGLSPAVSLPLMAPELAFQNFQSRSARQSGDLAAYSATTLIRAQLPDTSQYGELEVQRRYTTPHELEFKAVHFSGDGFVKTNVITRILQSEVDQVRKNDASLTALTPANYKFSYKGLSQINGRPVHVYQVKPNQKRVGLFKGRVFLDACSGSLARVEGSIVKSPSFFVKKIDFTQDYADFGGFTFPVHMHSEARARIIGRAIVDIDSRDYEPVAAGLQSAQQTPPL